MLLVWALCDSEGACAGRLWLRSAYPDFSFSRGEKKEETAENSHGIPAIFRVFVRFSSGHSGCATSAAAATWQTTRPPFSWRRQVTAGPSFPESLLFGRPTFENAEAKTLKKKGITFFTSRSEIFANVSVHLPIAQRIHNLAATVWNIAVRYGRQTVRRRCLVVTFTTQGVSSAYAVSHINDRRLTRSCSIDRPLQFARNMIFKCRSL